MIVSVNREDLEEVIRLALLTESRSNAEQKALLRVARRVDTSVNTTASSNIGQPRSTYETVPGRFTEGRYGRLPVLRLKRRWSYLEAEAEQSRDLDPDNGDKPVTLPDTGRWQPEKGQVFDEGDVYAEADHGKAFL